MYMKRQLHKRFPDLLNMLGGPAVPKEALTDVLKELIPESQLENLYSSMSRRHKGRGLVYQVRILNPWALKLHIHAQLRKPKLCGLNVRPAYLGLICKGYGIFCHLAVSLQPTQKNRGGK